jgi:hypothetical protein
LGNLEWNLFARDFVRQRKVMYKRHWTLESLSIGTLLGNLEGVRLLELLREKGYAILGPRGHLKGESGGHLEQ